MCTEKRHVSYVLPTFGVFDDAASLGFLTYHPIKQAKSLKFPKSRKVKDFGAKTDILWQKSVEIGRKVNGFGAILLSVIF